ncbi:zf-HC2 domain-containing protein [Acidobacteria bacterium AB60]|nr:zf-HC2 domain-containing protein [Acidobacteria bacterium AB60]
MADRIHIPSSPACGLWETLLADALDGTLRAEDEATFSSHMAGCAACTALFDEARRGREWLEFLAAEPEVPGGLLDKILAQTGPGQTAGYGLVNDDNLLPANPTGIPLAKGRPIAPPAWQRPGFMGFVRRFAEPRLMMTAAMAFFSIALTLNLTGVRLSSIKLSDLKYSSMRSLVQRRLTMASTPIIRYYDNLRLVYEVQSRVRELRRNSQDNQPQPKQQQPSGPGESKQVPKTKDGGSRVDPPQQSVSPALLDPDYLETRLEIDQRPAHSGGSAKAIPGRSTVWIA